MYKLQLFGRCPTYRHPHIISCQKKVLLNLIVIIGIIFACLLTYLSVYVMLNVLSASWICTHFITGYLLFALFTPCLIISKLFCCISAFVRSLVSSFRKTWMMMLMTDEANESVVEIYFTKITRVGLMYHGRWFNRLYFCWEDTAAAAIRNVNLSGLTV